MLDLEQYPWASSYRTTIRCGNNGLTIHPFPYHTLRGIMLVVYGDRMQLGTAQELSEDLTFAPASNSHLYTESEIPLPSRADPAVLLYDEMALYVSQLPTNPLASRPMITKPPL
jgi:hypothetical protein